jgi:hypothetical protein
MHYSYEEKLSAAETKRLDGIRAIDDKAITMANEKATQQASVLQSQVSAAAETQRALVTTTAQTIATQLQQIVTPMNERVSVLEKANFEGQGKSTINEPLMASMLNELKALGAVTASVAAKIASIDPILAAMVDRLGAMATKIESVSVNLAVSKGSSKVSIPLMLSLVGLAGVILGYFLTHWHGF